MHISPQIKSAWHHGAMLTKDVTFDVPSLGTLVRQRGVYAFPSEKAARAFVRAADHAAEQKVAHYMPFNRERTSHGTEEN